MSSLSEQASQKQSTNNEKMDDLLEEAEERKRLQCWVPAKLHQRLKTRAARTGTTMTDITERALRRFLD
jgi:hypothetical protein